MRDGCRGCLMRDTEEEGFLKEDALIFLITVTSVGLLFASNRIYLCKDAFFLKKIKF